MAKFVLLPWIFSLKALGIEDSVTCSAGIHCQVPEVELHAEDSLQLLQHRAVLEHGSKSAAELGHASDISGSLHQSLTADDSISTLSAESEALDHLLSLAANGMVKNVTYDFLHTLKLCAACNSFKRYGETDGGAYMMCADNLAQGFFAAFSLGINGMDDWGVKVASRFRVPVFEFDCYNTNPPDTPPGLDVRFFRECLIGALEPRPKEDRVFRTLTELVGEHSPHAGTGSLLLKVDVEGAEWKALSQVSSETLQKFQQIVIELHDIGDTTKHALYHQTMTNLAKAGFRPAHLHGNNWGPMANFGEYAVPAFLEVTFLPWSGKECRQTPYHLSKDLPTNNSFPELPDAKLP